MDKTVLFKKKYGSFCDVVIERLNYKLEYIENFMELEVIARNIEYSNFNVYENILIKFNKIKKFKFYESMGATNHITVLDCNILKISGLYVFDFIPWGENLTDLDEIRKSNFYIICEDFEFTSSPVVRGVPSKD
ncbi:hypothetical protein [Runella sp. SP2]|uniref:hypothetical protein n=1 Tax=Runella sp. SP2 TaxID=2268026 RepID=UPI000F074419|nr:hypothetical protein [Runella sp. SP2]AYQ32281.1 hypothetical protein DTQ70_08855 [Runella sp. SP2]